MNLQLHLTLYITETQFFINTSKSMTNESKDYQTFHYFLEKIS